MKNMSPKGRTTSRVATGAGFLTTAAMAATAMAAPPSAGPGAATLATQNANVLVASRPAFLHASPNDKFVQGSVVSSSGTHYVPYERTYADLPVVGGDFVLVMDSAGQVVFTSTALEHPIGSLPTTPTLSKAAAEAIAVKQLRSVTRVEGTQLVVNALDATARLAWESTVDGLGANGISRLTVDVDAVTGAVLRQQEHVVQGSGTAAWNGPNPVALRTTKSGSTFSMRDPVIANLSCQDAANNTVFSGPDDLWGNGNATVRETGCVDALFGAQTEAGMLSQWLGRNGMDGAGGAWPIRVGLDQQNAFYDGTQIQIGHNSSNRWIGSIDVIAHEMGHGIDDHTPGGISRNGTQEFIADAFGAATEWFANEPPPFDVPDFLVGEQINLQGSGPIRNMFNPSAVHGDPNCYSSSIPSTEVHAAAGPGNHWFYLVAEGSNPTNGQPTSPTCNGSTVVGLGVQSAIKILYNAMLMKTTKSSYLSYRTWTLQAAKNLFPASCEPFNTVKAAWDAVSVPAQASDPTCRVFVGQQVVVDVGSTPGWTSIVPMNLNNDGLTDLLAYNATTGRAQYSVNTGGGGQAILVDVMSTPGWTSIVPMNLNNDGLTDLLAYNATTGRAQYSVNAGGGGQTLLIDVMSTPGWTSIVPMDLNNDGLTDLLAYNATTGRAQYSVNTGGGGQTLLIDVMSTPGWTSIVPMNLDNDGLTDLLAYNATTGRAQYSVNLGGGGQAVVIDVVSTPGWTSIVPMDLNDDGLTDLLAYNAATGRAQYSVNLGGGGQTLLIDMTASPGWTSIVPMNLNSDGLTDLLSYNRTTGRAVYSVAVSASR